VRKQRLILFASYSNVDAITAATVQAVQKSAAALHCAGKRRRSRAHDSCAIGDARRQKAQSMYIATAMCITKLLQLVHSIICEFSHAARVTVAVHPAVLFRKWICQQLLVPRPQQSTRIAAAPPIHIRVGKRKLQRGRASTMPCDDNDTVEVKVDAEGIRH
jgi:hypothetical protein